jgi:hypothetical protein
MIAGILKTIAGFFSGNGVGSVVGNAVANTASTVALIAAIAPAVIWFIGNKDTVFITFTYGQTAVGFGVLFIVLKIVHYTRAGKMEDRQ